MLWGNITEEPQMDFLKKVELLINAKSHSVLPRRERRSILDKEEAKVLAEIRRALKAVEAKEKELAGRLKMEWAEAKDAAARGDQHEQRAHERRAKELEQKLDNESIQAIDLEEKLAALEEKLVRAKEAVEQEARKVAQRDAEASQVLAQGEGGAVEQDVSSAPTSIKLDIVPDDFSDDEPDVAARKSRLSG
jgi:hypothetical protein